MRTGRGDLHWTTSKCNAWCLICRVGQNHIYTVYLRFFWQGNHQIYGHIRCIYTVLANPRLVAYGDKDVGVMSSTAHTVIFSPQLTSPWPEISGAMHNIWIYGYAGLPYSSQLCIPHLASPCTRISRGAIHNMGTGLQKGLWFIVAG